MKEKVPKEGKYTTEGKTFIIVIKDPDGGTGNFKGVYTAEFSPEGRISRPCEYVRYFWVANESIGHDGVAPFSIHLMAFVRPKGRPYCIIDSWTGAYREDDTMIMSGSRSYVNEKGVVDESVYRCSFG